MYFIYEIVNIINFKRYIGQTGQESPLNRKAQHLCNLRANKHVNNHLQSAFNKYGEVNFTFQFLCRVEENVQFYEQFYIDLFQTTNPQYGYNKRSSAPSNKGMKLGPQSPEHRQKIANAVSKARIGKFTGKDNPNYQRFQSLEERKRRNNSEFPGTSWSKQKNAWRARCHVNNKEYHVGFFETQQEAYEAYCKFLKQYNIEK